MRLRTQKQRIVIHTETKNVPKGTLHITLTNASQYLISGLFYVLVAKTNALTQADMGILAMLNFLVSAFLLTTLSLPTALTKFVSEKLEKNAEETTAIKRTVTKMVLTTSVIGFAISVIICGWLSEYFWGTSQFAFLIVLIATHAVIFNLITLLNSCLQALHFFGKLALVTFVFIAVSRIAATVLALLNLGLEGVLIGYVMGSSTALFLALAFTNGKFPKTSRSTSIKPMLRFSFPLFIGSLSTLVLSWADIVIVNVLTSNNSLTGAYYMVVNSTNVLSVLWVPITITLFPALSVQNGLKNTTRMSNMVRTAGRCLSYIVFPICLGLAAISPTALVFFYGQNYLPGALPLSILSIATIIATFYNLFNITLIAIGKTFQVLKINMISAISELAILPIFVVLLEANGAAIARLATLTTSLVLSVYALRKNIKLQLDKVALWKAALASTATLPFLFALESAISARIPVIETLLIEITAAASIYLVFLYTLKALKTQDFDLLRQSFPKKLSKYVNFLERIFVR